MGVQKFKKFPLEVGAVQFSGDVIEIFQWVNASLLNIDPKSANLGVTIFPATSIILLKTPLGDIQLVPGDWLVKDENSSFVVMKPADFEAMYEVV